MTDPKKQISSQDNGRGYWSGEVSAVVDDVLRAAAVQARTGHTLAVLENLYIRDRSIIKIE